MGSSYLWSLLVILRLMLVGVNILAVFQFLGSDKDVHLWVLLTRTSFTLVRHKNKSTCLILCWSSFSPKQP